MDSEELRLSLVEVRKAHARSRKEHQLSSIFLVMRNCVKREKVGFCYSFLASILGGKWGLIPLRQSVSEVASDASFRGRKQATVRLLLWVDGATMVQARICMPVFSAESTCQEKKEGQRTKR